MLFKTDINCIHTFRTTLKIKCHNVVFYNIANNIIYMEEILFNTVKIFNKAKSLASLKNFNPSSQDRRLLFFLFRSCYNYFIRIYFFLFISSVGGVEVIMPFSST